MSDARIPVPVAVAGSGLVGSALALSLARAGVPVEVFDGRSDLDPVAPAQRRPIALSAASVRILSRLGVWSAIAPQAQPILSVHVSERGRFGRVRMGAGEHGLDALGHVTDAATLDAVLHRALVAQPALCRRPGSPVLGATPRHDRIQLQVGGAALPLDARLLVAADGAASGLRGSLGLNSTRREYEQQAVVCNVTLQGEHRGVAYERFLESGPLALLPLPDRRCGVVWTVPQSRAPALAALTDAAFLGALSEAFGHRLGRFTGASRRQCFVLSRTSVSPLYGHRGVCIGNAANQLHPVAGQGLNLGLRDAATLAELLVHAHGRGHDLGHEALLARYSALRRADHRRVIAFTDFLARGFSQRPRVLGRLRSIALLGLQLTPPARAGLARIAMGLRPPLPRAATRLEP